MLDAKFQRAIDWAKRKARIVTAQEDVAQWRRRTPCDGDPSAAAAEAAPRRRILRGTPRQDRLQRRHRMIGRLSAFARVSQMWLTWPRAATARTSHCGCSPVRAVGEVADGTTVLAAARQLGVDLDSVRRPGICGRCQVVPSIGSFAKWQLTTTGDEARALVGPGTGLSGAPAPWRRAPPRMRRIDPRRRRGRCAGGKSGASPGRPQAARPPSDRCRPGVRPALSGDPRRRPRIGARRSRPRGPALAEQHGEEADSFDAAMLARCTAHRRRNGDRGRGGSRVVAAWPGFVDEAFGVAVDVGSTTIAGYLCALFAGEVAATGGRMNPQIRFGEDLMSRVSYVMMNPGGDRQLTDAVRQAIDALPASCLPPVSSTHRVLDLVIVGNPIMHHLVLGIDPAARQRPVHAGDERRGRRGGCELDLDLPFASFYAGPCIAGHVGADAAAMILAEGPHRSERCSSSSTSGPMPKSSSAIRRLLAASSPTGPAFEGAQISCGQRATTGAVESVRIDRNTLAPASR